MSLPKLIVLQSSDKETFEVNEAVAVQLLTIKHMIIDNCPGSYIPVRNVRGKILAKVIEYCTKHIDVAKTSDDEIRETQDDALKAFDKEFVNVDQETLFDVMLAANYLEIKSLLDLTCQTVAYMMKGKKVEEIREIFHIKNDYTPEEEEEVRRENAWAFE